MLIKIITYLFAIIIQTHCVKLDKTGDDMSYVSNDDNVYERDDHYDINDKKKYQLTTMLADEESTEGTTDLIKTKKRSIYSRNFSLGFDPLPAVRTDVIAQLQEQRSKHVARKGLSSYDINYQLPEEVWPIITFSIQKVSSLSLPTPPSVPTRTFRDHFQSVRLDYRPKYTANLEFLSTKRSKVVSSSRDISAVSNFWEHNFLKAAEPAWYAVYGIVPTAANVPGLTNNPGILTKSSTSNTALRKTLNSTSKTGGDIQYHLQGQYEEDLKRYYDINNDVSIGVMFLPFDPDIARDNQNVIPTDKPTTIRSTRTYPRPKWICYECGRNETKFGSSFCHDVFDNPNGRLSGKKSSLRYRCIGNLSMAYQCFKRFVDVGYYNERGCREWPPRTSGKTYASKRLRALERMLKDTDYGCVFTPRAYLLSLSRTVQLYVRFHACVCKGTLCNGASTICSGPWLVLIISISFIDKILWRGL